MSYLVSEHNSDVFSVIILEVIKHVTFTSLFCTTADFPLSLLTLNL